VNTICPQSWQQISLLDAVLKRQPNLREYAKNGWTKCRQTGTEVSWQNCDSRQPAIGGGHHTANDRVSRLLWFRQASNQRYSQQPAVITQQHRPKNTQSRRREPELSVGRLSTRTGGCLSSAQHMSTVERPRPPMGWLRALMLVKVFEAIARYRTINRSSRLTRKRRLWLMS